MLHSVVEQLLRDRSDHILNGMQSSEICKVINGLSPATAEELLLHSSVMECPAESILIRDGEFIKGVPFVLNGLVKVCSRYQDREMLLYHVQPGESCVMSFSAALQGAPSRISATMIGPGRILLLPGHRIGDWMRTHSDLHQLYFQQYHHRYSELLDTIHHLRFDHLEERLFRYLREQTRLTESNPLHMSHRQIAEDMGTSREVVSRVLKRMEQEGIIRQDFQSIELLRS